MLHTVKSMGVVHRFHVARSMTFTYAEGILSQWLEVVGVL